MSDKLPMSFIWPAMLVLLILVPILIGVYIIIQRKRRRVAGSFVNPGFTQGLVNRGPGFRRHIPPAVFLAGLAILLVGMARPVTVVSLPRVEGTVILAFDVSGSMAATDIKPTRLDASKAAVTNFVKGLPVTAQIGVVGFTDSGFSVQAPTNDQDAILSAIKRLTPQRGTSIGQGITASLNTIAAGNNPGPLAYSNLTPQPTPSPTPVPQGTYTSAVIILLTDGDNNENPDPLAVAQIAAQRGVRIYTVGIGSAAGTDVHVNGFTVHTQLDEATLQQISQITGGTYYNAQSAQDLQKIYSNLDPQLIIKPEKLEITSIFAGASILVMLTGGVFSLLWFNRLP